MTPGRLVFIFLAVITAVRLVLIAQFELFPDEAYYFMWSERMDYSYFSKGPGVAATMWLGTFLFGDNEFGVRFFSPLLSLGTSLLMWFFVRRLYDESTALWAVVLINLTPIFNVGSVVMTIDPLSIFFWVAALYTLWRALERGTGAAPARGFNGWWPATGALIGAGFLCKWTNAMQLLSIVLLLAFTQRYRKEFKRSGFWIMFGVFLLFTIPPVMWNARHDWVTLAHLSARGGMHEGFRLRPNEALTFLAMHFGVYSPLIFAGLLIALYWSFRIVRRSYRTRFLLAFALPLLVLYGWLSLKQAGEANWTAPGVVSLAILAVALWHDRASEQKWARQFAVAALALGGLMSVLILNTDLLRAAGVPLPYAMDPGARMRGWRTAAEQIESFRKDFESRSGQPVFLIANEHELASVVAFYFKDKRPEGPGHPPIYIPAEPYFVDQYSFWPRYDELIELKPGEAPSDPTYTEEQGYNPFRERTALYITDRPESRVPTSLQRGFERWEVLTSIDQARRGLPLRRIRIFACYNYLDPGVQ